ncbi:hypothetical protein P7C70_g4247, partial [Phenoliferia sp. Uapishka_3]
MYSPPRAHEYPDLPPPVHPYLVELPTSDAEYTYAPLSYAAPTMEDVRRHDEQEDDRNDYGFTKIESIGSEGGGRKGIRRLSLGGIGGGNSNERENFRLLGADLRIKKAFKCYQATASPNAASVQSAHPLPLFSPEKGSLAKEALTATVPGTFPSAKFAPHLAVTFAASVGARGLRFVTSAWAQSEHTTELGREKFERERRSTGGCVG